MPTSPALSTWRMRPSFLMCQTACGPGREPANRRTLPLGRVTSSEPMRMPETMYISSFRPSDTPRPSPRLASAAGKSGEKPSRPMMRSSELSPSKP